MNPIEKVVGPCVILAGAGTGKTHTIVEKIKYLIKNKIYSPERIVCITFSNEAANSLRMRVHRALELDKEPIVRTFHAFSADLLRKYGDKIGIKKDFNILESDEAKIVLHRNFKVPAMNCHLYMNSIGIAKDLGISKEELHEYLEKRIAEEKVCDLEGTLESLQFNLQTMHLSRNDDKEERKKIAEKISRLKDILSLKKFIKSWKAYEKIKEAKNYLDYSDLNNDALRLLKNNPQIAEDFDYLIVDEFQDTNKVQLDLLIALCKNRNITVVGDMNQSIYRFRGAYKENFPLFKEHFAVGKEDIFTLDKSHRSPNKILRTAHDLIFHNYSNKEDLFFVENVHGREGEKIEVYQMKNAKEEARKVCELIEREVAQGIEMEEICVMFRTHQQGRIIKKTLESRGIQHISVTKNSLLKHRSVRTATDYLSVLNKLVKKEKGGEAAWWDLIYNMKFPEQDMIEIGKFIKKNKESENISAQLLLSLEKLPVSEEGAMLAKSLIEKIKLLIPSSNKEVSELLLEVYRVAGIFKDDRTREAREITSNLNKFYELAKNHSALHFPDLDAFLHYLTIVEDLGIEIDSSEIEDRGVRLMTLHSTKGLEYKTVIITNLAQKRFPIEKVRLNPLIPPELFPEIKPRVSEFSRAELELFVKDYESQNQLFDERRLCYVAFTRAKNKLILTYAQEYGGNGCLPSKFLEEVKFNKNPDFSYVADMEEKFVEPAEIKNALGISAEGAGVETKPEKLRFSPSALLLFKKCQKNYEYKYVFNMPERKTMSWEAMLLGSFVHLVLEEGVKANFKSLKEFVDLAKELNFKEDWQTVNLDEALHLVKVFYERNKNKYNENSKTELFLSANIGGFDFVGYADRIDESGDGLEIIDYKTGASYIQREHRDWQLGYYAIAARKYGKVKKLTLEMLKQEKPIEFVVDENGIAKSVDSYVFFDIHNVEEELARTARAVSEAYGKGFKPCPVEKNCEFCSEYVYGF